MNPYEASETLSLPTDHRRSLPVSTMFGLCIGGLLLLVVLVLAGQITYLSFRYPGLNDPPSSPVDYWPEVVVSVSSIVIVIGLLIGLPVFLTSVATLRRFRAQSRADVLREGYVGFGEESGATEDAS